MNRALGFTTPTVLGVAISPSRVDLPAGARHAIRLGFRLAGASVNFDADGLMRVFLDGRTPRTREAYEADVADFARFTSSPTSATAAAYLLSSGHGSANALVLEYRADLQNRKLAPATINRRLAALRSCVAIARLLGHVSWSIDVPNLKVETYRDTRGPGREGVAWVLAVAERARDRAIVRLLHDLGLRRIELHRLDIEDVDVQGRRLRVQGKGRSAKIWLSMPNETTAAVVEWMTIGDVGRGPLFIALDRAHRGMRLSGTSIYRIVRGLGEKVGVRARPHGLRHMAYGFVDGTLQGSVALGAAADFDSGGVWQFGCDSTAAFLFDGVLGPTRVRVTVYTLSQLIAWVRRDYLRGLSRWDGVA